MIQFGKEEVLLILFMFFPPVNLAKYPLSKKYFGLQVVTHLPRNRKYVFSFLESKNRRKYIFLQIFTFWEYVQLIYSL